MVPQLFLTLREEEDIVLLYIAQNIVVVYFQAIGIKDSDLSKLLLKFKRPQLGLALAQ
jgi:hypothetical protein